MSNSAVTETGKGELVTCCIINDLGYLVKKRLS